jgi:hypothetical protein
LLIWTFEAQVMIKRKAGSQIASLTSDQKKSEIDPIYLGANDVRHTVESSQQELQLRFRLHLDWKSARKVTAPQSCGSLEDGNFGTFTWESWDKKSFGCESRGQPQSIL